MGAENSILEGCSWNDDLVCPTGFLWKLSPITKLDGTEGVVFQAKNPEKKDSELLQKCAKTLLRLRHPNVIRFLGSGGSSKGFWMATEPVSPIVSSLSELTSEELTAGIQDILQALDFMHSKLGVCHNNVCPSSVYVSKDGGWKLGGMEHSCRFQESTPEYLDSCRVFRDEASLAPEEKAGQVKTDLSQGHARDVFAIGALVDVLMDMVKEKDGLLRELEQQITICVSADPTQRPTVSTLLKLPIFKSDFISIITFVRNVTVKSATEKTEFFRNLLPKLRSLPESVIARRMVVPLLSRFVLLDEVAQTKVLPCILVPRKDSPPSKDSRYNERLLSESLYQEYIIPHLCNVFRVHDYHIRMVLLKYFSTYVHLFSRTQLENEIFLQILLGVRDSDDKLVAASLKALADLVPILGGDYVIGGARKTFFFHGLPKQITMETESELNGPLNVGSVLSKANPPLLKDVAAGAKNSSASLSVSAEERERKMKERQQKRDEARLKREERRRKLKEKQLQEIEESADKKQANSVGKEEYISTPTIEEIAGIEEGKKSDDVLSDVDESLTKENGGVDGQEEIIEKEASDWSDWEDADKTIDDEIEEELRNMSSSESAATENKVQTSPSPYRSSMLPPSPPPMSADWSDMPEADRTPVVISQKSPAASLHSRGDETISRLPPESGDKTNTTHSSGQGYHSSRDVSSLTSPPRASGKTLRLKSSSSSASSSSSPKAVTKKNAVDDDLGLGYDIKSIQVKKSSSSMQSDFFADMMPDIAVPTSSAVDILSPGKSIGLSESIDQSKGETDHLAKSNKTSGQSSLFAMDHSTVSEETSGWGADDDLDWGNDNF